MTGFHECTVVVRYQSESADGWPWAVTQDGDTRILTITDLDDSSLGILLRAIAQAGDADDQPAMPGRRHELATT